MRVEIILFCVIAAIAFIIWRYGWWKADRTYWRGYWRGFRMAQNAPVPPEHYNVDCIRLWDNIHEVDEAEEEGLL